MAESEKISSERREFLKMAAGSAAAWVVKPGAVSAQQSDAAANMNESEPPEPEVLITERPGSDFMVDVIKAIGFDYVCSNPGSSFRSLQESVINYGGNRSPEFLTCCHEESSVAMAHGYYKIEGKPLLVFAHGTVGLQHASMAVYNAFCDRVPVYMILGNTLDATKRRPGAEWYHSVQDAAAMVRDYTKWDDMPVSLGHFAESAIRAYKIAMTPPRMPVALVVDSELQELPIADGPRLRIPKLSLPAPPQGDSGAVEEAARMLVAADNPVIVADRLARTAAGMKYLIELAELLQAPVLDQGGRMNFPSNHPLNHNERRGAVLRSADVILGLESSNFWGVTHAMRDQLHRTARSHIQPAAKLISITAGDLYTKSNYQDFLRFQPVDLALAADGEATMPSLIEAVRRLLTADRKRTIQDRGAKLATARKRALEQVREEAAYGWDASPISTARLAAELWAQIKTKDWSLVSQVDSLSGWAPRIFRFEKHYHHIGDSGAAGIGYGAPAAVGAALANRKYGRLSINLQNDGDFMYAPGVLWTAAHHRIPLLTVMHNNRGYHAEVMHLQRMASRHNRDSTQAHIGTALIDPNLDYAQIARGMGWYAEGPISDPKDLRAAISRALAVVERGEPALLDTVTQPR